MSQIYTCRYYIFLNRHIISSGQPSADRKNPDWAPTKRMGHKNIKDTSLAISRSVRATGQRKKRKIEGEAMLCFEKSTLCVEADQELELCQHGNQEYNTEASSKYI